LSLLLIASQLPVVLLGQLASSAPNGEGSRCQLHFRSFYQKQGHLSIDEIQKHLWPMCSKENLPAQNDSLAWKWISKASHQIKAVHTTSTYFKMEDLGMMRDRRWMASIDLPVSHTMGGI